MSLNISVQSPIPVDPIPMNTRIAPSPTGGMHFGTLRTAYFNWLAARSSKGRFLVRIDDTDAARNVKDKGQEFFDTLDFLGLSWDASFNQSEYAHIHRDYIETLVDERYAARTETGAVLITEPILGETWHDELTGPIEISPTVIAQASKICLLRGGRTDAERTPTYQLASVVDDWRSHINHIIRGTDHISNTPKQIAIWNALNCCFPNDTKPLPKFSHVGLIFAGKGQKLSKRVDKYNFTNYIKEGIHPDALLNFMLRLGWSPSQDNKLNSIIPKSRAISMFLKGGRMSNREARMDLQKLAWFDKKYKHREANPLPLAYQDWSYLADPTRSKLSV